MAVLKVGHEDGAASMDWDYGRCALPLLAVRVEVVCYFPASALGSKERLHVDVRMYHLELRIFGFFEMHMKLIALFFGGLGSAQRADERLGISGVARELVGASKVLAR